MPLCPSCSELMRIRRNRATKEFFYGCTDFPSCRGTRPFDTAGDGSGPGDGSGRRGISYQRNEFVHVRHRGFGKISFVEDDDATEAEVEFFTSPADGGTETVPLPIRKVRGRGATTTHMLSPGGSPEAALKAEFMSARPTTSATRQSKTATTSTISMPRSCTFAALIMND